jgi:N-ethylmaleimide reductase
MVKYYEQRANAGHIITEGTSPSPTGLGYSKIPGIFNETPFEGWEIITNAVHSKYGKIFLQLMNTGRISHHANIPEDAIIILPSSDKSSIQILKDAYGLQDIPIPTEMIIEEINHTKQEYISAAARAIEAGFDGIELQCNNDYLLKQFSSPVKSVKKDNIRRDIENRCRFLLEVIEDVIEVVGKEKVGLCFSPYGITSDTIYYPEIVDTYEYLAEKLNIMGILYIHLLDYCSMGAPEISFKIKKAIRKKFAHTLIFSGGYTMEHAENELESGLANLIAFGRSFINNPDLVLRIANGWKLSCELDMRTFYSPGEKGYTDYPVYTQLSSKSL